MSWASRTIALMVLGVALLAGLTACGGDDPEPTPTSPPAAAEPTATPVPDAPDPAPDTMAPEATPTPVPAGATAAPATAAPTAAPPPTPTPIPVVEGFDAEGYFSGKTIKVIVGFSPGGGYDAYSRLVAKAVERLMPGNPKVIVSNLPGGGALRALQETMRSRPDGFTTHPMANRHPAAEAAGADLDDFDLNTVIMLGTPNFIQTHAALCVRREVAENWDDVLALGRPITFGTSALGGNAIGGQFAEALGAPVKVVLGYEGTADVQAAIDRNELDATDRCDTFFIDPFFPEWYEEQKLMPLFYWRTPISQSFLDQMNTGLRSEDVPHLFDAVNPNDEQKAAFLLAQNLESMTRMFVLAPETPDEIVQTWRRVFRDVTEDSDFQASAAALSREVNYGDPEILKADIEKAKDFSSEACQLFADLYGVPEASRNC